MTRFIIGTVAQLDRPLTPSAKGDLAVSRYLENINKQEEQKIRDQVLATSADDIRAMGKFVEDIIKKKTYCVYGNEDKIKSEKDMFDTVETLNP